MDEVEADERGEGGGKEKYKVSKGELRKERKE